MRSDDDNGFVPVPGDAAVERALHRGLEEVVGGARPPDVRAAVLAALAIDDDAALAPDPTARGPRWWWSAALVLLGVSAVVTAVLARRDPERSPRDTSSATTSDDDAARDRGAADRGTEWSGSEPPLHPHTHAPTGLEEFRSLMGDLTAVEFVPCLVRYDASTAFHLGRNPALHVWERDPQVLTRWKAALTDARVGRASSRGLDEYRAHLRLWFVDPDAATDSGGRYVLVALDERVDLRVIGLGALSLTESLRSEWTERVDAHERVARIRRGVVFSGAELAAVPVDTRMIRGFGLRREDLAHMDRFKYPHTLDLAHSPDIDQDALGSLGERLARRRASNEGWGSVSTLVAPKGILWGKTPLPELSALGPLFAVSLERSVFAGDPAAQASEYPLGSLTQDLSLRDAKLGSAWLLALTRGLSQLRRLDLSGADGLDPSILVALARTPGLEELSMAHTSGLENADFGELSPLPLSRLDLRGQPVDAAAFRALCKCVRLEHLALGGEPPDDAVEHLLMLPRLRSLTLTRPPVGIERLTDLVLLKRIEFTARMWAPEIQKIQQAFEAAGSDIELVFHSNW